MDTTTFSYDPTRERLNRIESWKIMAHLSFRRPVPEAEKIAIFLNAIRELARRIKINPDDLRWVLKEEGDFIHKLFHFHFLLDGSNLPNKDASKLAINFAKLWLKAGGGNTDVRPYAIERDPHGYQRAVNYITKLEGFAVPFSAFFNAGENCHLKFSDAMDRHIAAVCLADANATQNQKETHD
jgi:hypothetical protein